MQTVVALNSILGSHFILARLVSGLAINPVARGAPVFLPLLVLWFSDDCAKHRGRILLGLLVVALATPASVMLQKHLHVDVRPFFDPRLHLYLVNPERLAVWDRINSFPSDTATLFFALSTVVFLEWRWAGAVCFAWSFMTAGICRMALGFHYPVDVAAGILLGTGSVLLFSRLHKVQARIQSAVEMLDPHPQWVQAALFLFLADAFDLFPGLQSLMKTMTALGRRPRGEAIIVLGIAILAIVGAWAMQPRSMQRPWRHASGKDAAPTRVDSARVSGIYTTKAQAEPVSSRVASPLPDP